MEPGWIALNIVLFVGLFVLAAGYFWKDRRCHLLRIVGVLMLAVFFSLEVVRIINEGKDVWNVTFTSIAPPVFLFVAYQEYLSYRWDDHLSLRVGNKPLFNRLNRVYIFQNFLYLAETYNLCHFLSS